MVTTADYLKLHLIVFLWGFTAILGKLISLPPAEMVFYRTLLAAIGMAVLILFNRGSFRTTRRDFWILMLTGFLIAVHWLSFFVAGKIANISTSLVGFATCSLWAAFIEPIAKKRKIQWLEVGLGVTVLAGLVIILSYDFQYKLGLLLGIISGLTIAAAGVINSKIVTRMSAHGITFYEMCGACLGVALFFIWYIPEFSADHHLHLSPTVMDWVYIAIMAWACSVYAYSVSINLSKKISVFFIQLTLNLEPVYGIVLALIIFGQEEIMGFHFYAGTLVILAAVVAYPLMKGSLSSMRAFDEPAEPHKNP